MNRFFNIMSIAGPIFLLSLSAQASAEVITEVINDSALCRATVAALRVEWDEDIKNLPRDEKFYKERVEFAKLHRDIFKKTATLYNPANYNKLVQDARMLQRNQYIEIIADDLKIYLDSLNSNVAGDKDVAVIWSELVDRENGDVDFIPTICIGKESTDKMVNCAMYILPPIPILKKGLPVAPKTEYTASMVDDLMRQYIGPPPPNNPDFRDFMAKKLAEKHLYCPDYTPVATNRSNEKDALAIKASHFDGFAKDGLHNGASTQKGKPLNLRKIRSSSPKVAI